MDADAAAFFAASCKACGQGFAAPSLGDFAYGSCLFATSDGKHWRRVSGMSGFPARVAKCIESIPVPAETYLPVLAALADPVAGMPLSDRVSCPRCGSTDVALSDDIRLGMEPVREAMFSLAEASSDAELRERVASLASMSAGR
jgi:hypothetical protein